MSDDNLDEDDHSYECQTDEICFSDYPPSEHGSARIVDTPGHCPPHEDDFPSSSELKNGEDLNEFNTRVVNYRSFSSIASQSSNTEFERFLRKYRRSNNSVIQQNSDPLVVFIIDVDYTQSKIPQHIRDWHDRRSPITLPNPAPIVRIFGITENGDSVLLNIHGFLPYFYCQCPYPYVTEGTSANILKEKLQNALNSEDHNVMNVEIVKGRSVMGYSANPVDFYKVTMSKPPSVATARGYVEAGISMYKDEYDKKGSIQMPSTAFEANIPFVLRFLIDKDITGCSWIEVPEGTYFVREENHKSSHCKIEIDCDHGSINPKASEGEWLKIGPMTILSFDIECVKNQGKGFPVPKEDPIIQIASVVCKQGFEDDPICKTVFTLGSCAAIDGAVVVSFDDEKDMLKCWQRFLVAVDPDIMTGYNFVNFDLNYILERCSTLKVEPAKYLGRLKSIKSNIKESKISSRALGTHETKAINTDGRIQFDMLEAIRREYKLKSYTLNAVSSHFLNQQKEHVHYSTMGDLHRGNSETRKRIATYCIKDALLPVRLLSKLLFIYNYVEMSRVTGTPLVYLFTRGQQIKVTSQLLRKCKKLGYFIPSVRVQRGATDDRGAAFEGATVLEPIKGFYDKSIATLDFASLYPSIMMAHNLCYSTILQNQALDQETVDVTRTPTGSLFVKSTVRQGVLPLILNDLISARTATKKAMANSKDIFVKNVLNGRQLALKITANSVYGYTGAVTGGQLPCVEISKAVTAYGREMIDFTKEKVEEIFSVTNDYDCNAKVIYGDTDSVMVDFGEGDVSKIMELGKTAASLISAQFIPPIKLEFEKVFCPFLLMNKKRYAGLLWTQPHKYDYMDCKGIETVRRDFCPLVQQLVDTILKKILMDSDPAAAQECVHQTIADLLNHRIDMSCLVLSKCIGRDEYTAKTAHNELAKKLRERDPTSAPNIGDRVHYVIVAGPKNQPQYDRAEDPLYVLEHNLQIDTEYYLDSLKKPITRIFEGIPPAPTDLFTGKHTLTKKVMRSTAGALSKFTKTSMRCLGCRVVVNQGALCKYCRENRYVEVLRKITMEFREKEYEYSKLWTQCQRCQESVHHEVICQSRDCPIFYRRTKVKKEIESKQTDFLRIQNDF